MKRPVFCGETSTVSTVRTPQDPITYNLRSDEREKRGFLANLSRTRTLLFRMSWKVAAHQNQFNPNRFPYRNRKACHFGPHVRVLEHKSSECPGRLLGGIRDRRFQFCTLLADQRPRGGFAAGNFRTCANHAAAMVIVPELEAILSPPVQCSISAMARSSNRATSLHRAVRTINITRRVLISPEATNSLRSLWLTGEFIPIENRKPSLTPTVFSDQNRNLDGWPYAISRSITTQKRKSQIYNFCDSALVKN